MGCGWRFRRWIRLRARFGAFCFTVCLVQMRSPVGVFWEWFCFCCVYFELSWGGTCGSGFCSLLVGCVVMVVAAVIRVGM